MSPAPYRHEDIADGIAAKLSYGSSAFTETGERFYGITRSVFAVTVDTGQRFRVSVEEES
jgi:hypothetical protein